MKVVLNPRYKIVDVRENGKGEKVYVIETRSPEDPRGVIYEFDRK